MSSVGRKEGAGLQQVASALVVSHTWFAGSSFGVWVLERFSRVASKELPWCLGARASFVALGRSPSFLLVHLDSCTVEMARDGPAALALLLDVWCRPNAS